MLSFHATLSNCTPRQAAALAISTPRGRSFQEPEERLAILENAFKAMSWGLATFDLDFRCTFVNQVFASMYAKSPQAFHGRNVAEVLPFQGAKIALHLERCLREQAAVSCEVTLPRPGSSEPRTYLRTCQPLHDEEDRVIGISVTLLDITERKHTEAALRENEEHARHVIELNPHVQWTSDAAGEVFQMSARLEKLTGLPSGRLLRSVWLEAVHPEDASRIDELWRGSVRTGAPLDCEFRMRCGDDTWLWLRCRALCRRNNAGEIVQWYGMVEDIDDRRQIEEALREKTRRLEAATEQLAMLVSRDHLTGLANRRHFDLTLEREIRLARRSRKPLALLMLDVDRFKRYNDSYGHVAGDACLRKIGAALQRVTRSPEDLVARYGGEEFAVILPNTTESQALEVAVRAINEVRTMALEHSDSPMGRVTLSAGAAVLSTYGDASVSELTVACDLIQLADLALYAAKRDGRDRAATTQSVSQLASPQLTLPTMPQDARPGLADSNTAREPSLPLEREESCSLNEACLVPS